MRMIGLALAALLVPAAQAQESTAPVVYKADFTVRDSSDPGAKSPRKFSLLVNRGNKATFRIGNRVPYPTGRSEGVGQANTQFTYYDVGVTIDCVIVETGGKFAMHADIDLNTLSPPEKGGPGNPVISQIKLNMDTAVPPGKPTVVASFDDPATPGGSTSRRFDLEVTITKI